MRLGAPERRTPRGCVLCREIVHRWFRLKGEVGSEWKSVFTAYMCEDCFNMPLDKIFMCFDPRGRTAGVDGMGGMDGAND